MRLQPSPPSFLECSLSPFPKGLTFSGGHRKRGNMSDKYRKQSLQHIGWLWWCSPTADLARHQHPPHEHEQRVQSVNEHFPQMFILKLMSLLRFSKIRKGNVICHRRRLTPRRCRKWLPWCHTRPVEINECPCNQTLFFFSSPWRCVSLGDKNRLALDGETSPKLSSSASQ